MKKYLEKFSKPYQKSRIPFLLAEIITDGAGEMVDLIFRFANAPAALLLGSTPESLQDSRFCRIFPSERLPQFSALSEVAFRGSSASFEYTSLLGRRLIFTCYQPLYGIAACTLEEQHGGSGGEPPRRYVASLLAENLPGGIVVLEVGPEGIRSHSFNSRLCELSGYSRRDLLSGFANDFSPLIYSEDRGALLQNLLDAAHGGQSVNCDFRLIRRSGLPLWVNLRAKPAAVEGSVAVFYAILLDIEARRQNQERTEAALRQLTAAESQLNQFFDFLPGEFCLLRIPADRGGPELLRVNRGFSELLGYASEELVRRFAAGPLEGVHPDDRDEMRLALTSSPTKGDSLRRTVRIQKKSGQYLRLALEAEKQRQQDGSVLVCVSFSDVTRELSPL